MRGSAEAVAVARDVASSSPSKAASALDMMRYQRPSSDCLPLPNGIGSGSSGGASRKPLPQQPVTAAAAATAPRSSKDDVAPAVATDSSRLAAYMASASLEPKPRTRAPPPPAHQAAPPPSPAATVGNRSPARDHGHHQHPDLSDPASPSSTGELLLQWGQNKRSRGRRDAASSSGASPQRRQTVGKIQRRSSAAADKLMPPPSAPSYTRGSNLRISSPLHPRSGSGAGDAPHGRGSLPHHNIRSAEERAAGKSAAAAAAAGKAAQQHKAGLGAVMGLGVPEPRHQLGSGSGSQQGGAGASSSSSKPAPKLELPRIYTTLSRKEKEEDFLAMKGTKLPQRPKRRPKNVEKTVNLIVPGMWLTDVTRSRYEVREKKCPKKQQKNRGLKGMESMDSDSE
ncbi:hypothetical protein U9M48_044826 [Paspalum notatum var. saurae]|uniref:DUF1639 family protein n=1 Tax=Paspalum notatum var. saurae TaxID=547442 RepID=A0AAQ3UXX0_PASNO